jgi:hypothetical protein
MYQLLCVFMCGFGMQYLDLVVPSVSHFVSCLDRALVQDSLARASCHPSSRSVAALTLFCGITPISLSDLFLGVVVGGVCVRVFTFAFVRVTGNLER